MKLSILTPTYNRAEELKKLYKSIIINQEKEELDCEWLIMDDGSTDQTKQVVEELIKSKIVNIKYYYQRNQGKMIAINNLMQYALGDMIIECDSDDYFTKDAFKIVKDAYEENKKETDLYALVFLKYDQNDNNMGNLFQEDNHKSTMFHLYFKENITGEKALVFFSNKRKQYKHQLEKKEKFITEARMYHQMDLTYYVKCYNKPIMICEYRQDGYTKNIDDMFLKYPYGYYEYFKQMFQFSFKGVPFKKKLYIYKHYILFAYLKKEKNFLHNVKGKKNKLMILLLFIPGYIKIKQNNKYNSKF